MRLMLHHLTWLCFLPLGAKGASYDDVSFQPVGHRFPARADVDAITACHAGTLCVGPGTLYPLGRQPGVLFSSTFAVPALPEEHDPVETTYYDYFNIFWRSNPVGGYMNQFVPQLMLGNALANSSNYPDYDPYWIELETWHIGAQYFMGLCNGTACGDSWIAKAATGELIPVVPGEVIETSFQLVPVRGRLEWHLRVGVLGQPHRSSIVVADRPFMGLVESTTSWEEDTYSYVYVGSCLENYGMNSSTNYSPTWQIEVKTWSKEPASFWQDWRLDQKPTCAWQPKSTVVSNCTSTRQWALWKATLESRQFGQAVDTRYLR